jgi:hypothetical protein
MSQTQFAPISTTRTKGLTFELPDAYIGRSGIYLSVEYVEDETDDGIQYEYVVWIHFNDGGAVKWYICAGSMEINSRDELENEQAMLTHICEEPSFYSMLLSLLERIGGQKEAKASGISKPGEWDIRFPVAEGSTVYLADQRTVQMEAIRAGISFLNDDGKTCIMPLRDFKSAVEAGRIFRTREEADALTIAERENA